MQAIAIKRKINWNEINLYIYYYYFRVSEIVNTTQQTIILAIQYWNIDYLKSLLFMIKFEENSRPIDIYT